MRLKSEIWVKAYIRRCACEGVPAIVARRGDQQAGSIYIRVCNLDGQSWVYCPAPAGWDGVETDRKWCAALKSELASDAEADDYISRQYRLDPDIWVIEVEDRQGRHFLEDDLVRF